MRGIRTPLILAAVAVVLGGYIWFYDSKSETTDQAALAARKLLRGFERDKVKSIELSRSSGEKIVLERTGEDWRIVQPIGFPADRAAIDEMLSGLEFLEQQRAIQGRDVRAEYELDKPRVRLRTRGGAHEVDLSISGRQDATGRSTFLQRGTEARVFVIDKHFAEQVDKSADDLRDKRVVPLDRTKVSRIRLGAVELKRDGALWRLHDGIRADAGRIGEVEKALEELRATRWVNQKVARPTLVVAADEVTVKMGGACPGGSGEVLAERQGRDDATFCLKQADLAKLAIDPAALRDGRLLAARADEVKAITIEGGGAKVALAREDGAWKLKAPAGQAAEDEAVRKWIDDVGAYRALEFVPLAANPAKQGLSHPTVITVETETGGKEVLRLGDAAAGRRHVRRGEEPVVLAVHAEIGAEARPDPLLFRSRRVLSFVRFDARRLQARQGGVEETAEKGDGDSWRLKTPVAIDADADVMDKLLGALGDLRAERYLAAAPAGTMAAPRVLTVTIDPPPGAKPDAGAEAKTQIHAVEVGGDAEGGCVARADGGPAFVVAREKCGDLRAHLAARKLLTLAEDKLTAFELSRGAHHELAEKRGPVWYSGSARLEQSKIDSLVSMLRSLAARDAVAYGADKSGPHGLDKPRFELRIKTDGTPDVLVSIGAADPHGNAYARVSGRAVTYLLPKDTVETLERTSFTSEKTN